MRNHSIDTLKYICAVLVVFLHVKTPYCHYYMPLTRCAVPTFLIISGYLLYNENNLTERLTKNIKHIAWIGLWATLVFIPLKIIEENGIGFLSLNSFVKWGILNVNPFGFHLWYLHAYLYSLLVVLLFYKYQKLNILYCITPLLLMTDLALGKYSLVLFGREFPFIYVRNFLCIGIPYVLIGFLIKKYEYCLMLQGRRQLLLWGGAICCISTLCEYTMLWYLELNATRDHYIGSTFLSVVLVLIALNYRQESETQLAKQGRIYSLYIYILHVAVLMMVRYMNKYVMSDTWNSYIYPYIAPFLVFVLTMVLICVLNKSKILKI